MSAIREQEPGSDRVLSSFSVSSRRDRHRHCDRGFLWAPTALMAAEDAFPEAVDTTSWSLFCEQDLHAYRISLHSLSPYAITGNNPNSRQERIGDEGIMGLGTILLDLAFSSAPGLYL